MKIEKVIYQDGEARFLLEGFPEKTFCLSLNSKHPYADIEAVKDALIALVPPETPEEEQVYNDLKIKDLEGTDLNA